MNAAQHKLFTMLVQGACESRGQLHEVAWAVLGVLLVGGIIALGAIWLWILSGGFSNRFHLGSESRRGVEA